MDSFLIAQKKGYSHVSHGMEYLIGGVILIVLVTSLAPTIFGNVTNLSNTTLSPGVPAFVPVVLFVVIGAGLIFMIWKAFGGK